MYLLSKPRRGRSKEDFGLDIDVTAFEYDFRRRVTMSRAAPLDPYSRILRRPTSGGAQAIRHLGQVIIKHSHWDLYYGDRTGVNFEITSAEVEPNQVSLWINQVCLRSFSTEGDRSDRGRPDRLTEQPF